MVNEALVAAGIMSPGTENGYYLFWGVNGINNSVAPAQTFWIKTGPGFSFYFKDIVLQHGNWLDSGKGGPRF